MTDGELAALSQRGDRKAFGVLAQRWDRPLSRFLERLLGDREAARDVCQEAMLKAYTNIHRLRRPERFRSWLHQIAVNLCRDRARRTGPREVELEHAEETADVQDRDTDACPAQLDLVQLLQKALARLPADQRTAILLRELQGFTSAEIAAMIGVPAATVRSRIFYGLKTARQTLAELGVTRADLDDRGGPR